ncbi:MAG: helix-turn-helix domain-containing protein [Syntrophorhabdaceae bacterium]
MIKEKFLQKLVEDGLSQAEIADKCQCSRKQVIYWLKKYNLRTKYTTEDRSIPKEILKKLIEQGLTRKEIAEKCQCSKDKTRYWLDKYGLKTHAAKNYKREVFNIFCDICNRYIGKNAKNRSFCNSCVTKMRRVRVKLAAVKLLGGKCEICGWDGEGDATNFAAFEFHHKNKDYKDFTISKISNRGWNIIKKELSKCQLLCSRCHRIVHSERYDDNFMEYAYNYHGDQLDF